MEWQPIETAPEGHRVFVCGYQKKVGSVEGYWWWHEDVIFDGISTEHPTALYWCEIKLPDFPLTP